jgi:ACS family tartrate transporter-like MFS transporter
LTPDRTHALVITVKEAALPETRSAEDAAAHVGERARRRTMVRLVPFLLLLYLVAFLDRVNVGYAALDMTHDLGFSSEVYGFGAGIFFVGYFLLEVPGTLLVERWSARRWIARIMIGWGLTASAMGLVRTEIQFYGLRFLLGAAEAGFFPGVIVYLSHWFRRADRARALALFSAGIPLSSIVGAPLSGLLLGVRWGGVAGWRWLFVIEGIPSVALGIATLFYLTDRPEHARWLPDEERRFLVAALARERAEIAEPLGARGIARALFRREVVLLVLAYFCIVSVSYGFSFWMPTVVKSLSGLPNLLVTVVAVLPYVSGLACLLVVGWSSDRSGERRWHTMVPMLMAGAGMLIAVPITGASAWGLLSLALVGAGIYGFMPSFWSLPPWFLSGAAAAAAVGIINSVGCLGGFAGPYLVGKLKMGRDTFAPGLLCLSGLGALSAVLVFLVRPPRPPDA